MSRRVKEMLKENNELERTAENSVTVLWRKSRTWAEKKRHLC